ncbi:MAG: hypothetical protein ACOC3Z_03580 [Nanoarchaeota archaeon]
MFIFYKKYLVVKEKYIIFVKDLKRQRLRYNFKQGRRQRLRYNLPKLVKGNDSDTIH